MAKNKWCFDTLVAGKNLVGASKISDIDVKLDVRLVAKIDDTLSN